MKNNLRIAILFTLVTTVLFGLVYPLVVTGLAQLLFPFQATGSLLVRDGRVIGSAILGQTFASPGYFHSRPSSAGAGYDASQSSGSNLGPTNHRLTDRVKAEVEKLHTENPGAPIPVDLVTSSGSGLDPGHFSGSRGVPGSSRRTRTRDERSRGSRVASEAYAGQAVWFSW